MKRCLAGSVLYLFSIPFLVFGVLAAMLSKSAIHDILAAVCFLAFIVAMAGGSIVTYLNGILCTLSHNITTPITTPIATPTRKREATFRCPDCGTEAPQSQFKEFPDNQVRCPNCMSLLAL